MVGDGSERQFQLGAKRANFYLIILLYDELKGGSISQCNQKDYLFSGF